MQNEGNSFSQNIIHCLSLSRLRQEEKPFQDSSIRANPLSLAGAFSLWLAVLMTTDPPPFPTLVRTSLVHSLTDVDSLDKETAKEAYYDFAG